ncbi:MAG: hypothetical protein HY904_24275 [Deltaproteobacteria bacterium]|nr:hypothetical protein [Deltaproteobacteria bacterium]
MKTLPVMSLLLAAAFANADPDFTDGQVRIPLATYLELKARAARATEADSQEEDLQQDEQEGAGTAPMVLEARISGRLTRRALELTVQATVEGTRNDWHLQPLLPDDVALAELTTDAGATVLSMDGRRYLAFAGTGRHTVTMKLVTSGGESGSSRQVDLAILPGASRQLALEVPPRLDVEVTPSDLVTTDRSGGKRVLRGYVPAGQETLSIRWDTDAVAEDAAPEPAVRPPTSTSKEPPRLNVTASMLASVGERLLTVYTTLRYAIFHAPVSRFEWTVPAGVEVIGVQGRGVTEWNCAPGQAGLLCSVELPFPVQRTYELSIQLEQALPKDLSQLVVPAPTARGVQRQSGHVAVEVVGSAEVKPADGTTAVREDVRELPPDLFAGQSTPILLAFKFLEPPVVLALDVKRRESVELSPISVDDAAYTTVWTTEGRTITEGTFQVRNRQRQFLAMRLPEGAVIQSAFVADAPVKPSTGDDGRLRIPLRSGRGAEGESFVVQVVYALDDQPLPAVGRMETLLPTMDAEVGALHHTLILPEHQQLWAFDGDLSTEPPAMIEPGRVDGVSFGLGMAKRDVMMAPPAAPPMQMAMERADLDEELALKTEDRREQARARVPRQSNIGALRMSALMGAGPGGGGMNAAVVQQGVLPVRIQIPQAGERYTAHAFYIPPDRALRWASRVASEGSLGVLWVLLALLGLALGVLAFRQGARLLVLEGMDRDRVLLLAGMVVAVVLTAYFRRHVAILPLFVLAGALAAWLTARLRSPRPPPAPAA